jgi:hypothetical protein
LNGAAFLLINRLHSSSQNAADFHDLFTCVVVAPWFIRVLCFGVPSNIPSVIIETTVVYLVCTSRFWSSITFLASSDLLSQWITTRSQSVFLVQIQGLARCRTLDSALLFSVILIG